MKKFLIFQLLFLICLPTVSCSYVGLSDSFHQHLADIKGISLTVWSVQLLLTLLLWKPLSHCRLNQRLVQWAIYGEKHLLAGSLLLWLLSSFLLSFYMWSLLVYTFVLSGLPFLLLIVFYYVILAKKHVRTWFTRRRRLYYMLHFSLLQLIGYLVYPLLSMLKLFSVLQTVEMKGKLVDQTLYSQPHAVVDLIAFGALLSAIFFFLYLSLGVKRIRRKWKEIDVEE